MDGWEFYPMFDVCIGALVSCPTSQSTEKKCVGTEGENNSSLWPVNQKHADLYWDFVPSEHNGKLCLLWGFFQKITTNKKIPTARWRLMMRVDVFLFSLRFSPRISSFLGFLIPQLFLCCMGFHLGCSTLALVLWANKHMLSTLLIR